MAVSVPQPSFALGEVSSSYQARTDLGIYHRACSRLLNFAVRPSGGIGKRPGFSHVAEVKDSSKSVRLIPFIVPAPELVGLAHDSIVLELGEGYIRFYDGRGSQITNGGTPVEVATPYSEIDLQRLQYAQSADMLFISSRNHMPQVLSRLSDTSWTFQPITAISEEFIPPLLPENASAAQIKVIGQCQAFRPAADVSLGTWSNPSWSKIDEATPSDSDYTSCTGTSTLKVRLGAGVDPDSDKNHILRVRLWAAAACDGSVTLYSGATPVASWLVRATTSAATLTFYLSPAQAALIANYADLQVEVTLTDGRVSWVELQAPYAAGSGLNTNVTGYPLLKGAPVTLQSGSNLFRANHWAFGIRHMRLARTVSIKTPLRGAFISTAIPVLGDWQITLRVDETYLRDEADLYLEKSVDDGETWFRIKTWPASKSTSDMAIAGVEDEPCYFRIGRDADPTGGDLVDFTVEVYGSPSWGYASVSGAPTGGDPGTSIPATLMTDFDQPGVALTSWAEAAWSDYRGWPECICFFEDRLCFANTASQPQTIWMSRSSDYTDFGVSLPVQDDDAVSVTLVSRSLEAIRAMVPLRDLLIFTSGGEWALGSDGQGPVTPSNVQARLYGSRGGAPVSPVVIGNVVIYVQAQKSALYELAYDYAVQGYAGDNISRLAMHLFSDYSILAMGYQQVSQTWTGSAIWCLRSDGKLIGITYQRESEVLACHVHKHAVADNYFESLCVAPASDLGDILWVVGRRTVEGQTKRFIERMSNVHCLDGMATYFGPPTTVITGLSHLEGYTVTAYTNGSLVTGLVVTNGQITLPEPDDAVYVGLPFTSEFATVGVGYETNDGSSADKKKRIMAVTLRLHNASGGLCGTGKFGPDQGPDRPIPYPAGTTRDYDGDVRIPLDSSYSLDGAIHITHDEPFGFGLNAVVPVVQHGG